jgi:hypothetical protein
VWAWWQTGPKTWDLRRIPVTEPIVKATPFDEGET